MKTGKPTFVDAFTELLAEYGVQGPIYSVELCGGESMMVIESFVLESAPEDEVEQDDILIREYAIGAHDTEAIITGEFYSEDRYPSEEEYGEAR